MMERRQIDRMQGYFRQLAYSAPPEKVADILQGHVEQMVRAGQSPNTLYEELKHLALELRRDGRDDLEDDVIDVMDVLVGWCAPSARL